MSKLYNQLKNIVAANVVRCARTTTYKHLGSLHNPLSHGNWSKGTGMYGGMGARKLSDKVQERLRQRQGMSGAARRAEASPAAAGLRRAQAGKSETQNFLNRGQNRETQNFLNRGQNRETQNFLNRGQKSEQQNFLNRGQKSEQQNFLNRGQNRETQNFLNRGQAGTGKRLQPDFPLWRGKKGAKDEPRTAVDFPRRGQAGTGKRLQPEARDNSNARRDAIAQSISILSGGRQRIGGRQAYEQRQKAPIVRTEDGLPKHYEWVYGKGGDRLLPINRPGRSEGGRQTMEYRAPLDSRGNRIAPEDMPRPRGEPYRPGKDKPEYRNMLK